MKAARLHSIDLCGQKVDFRLVNSRSARKLRVRVGIAGVEVVHPPMREGQEVDAFLRSNEVWIVKQLEWIERFSKVRRPSRNCTAEILYGGEPTIIEVRDVPNRKGPNKVVIEQNRIVIVRGRFSQTHVARSLENWLRKQAREEIERHIQALTQRLKRFPRKVYIMGQRTKWGNCSSLQNLSFNWRLILAPNYVLQYLVTHEVVHLAVPDHSKKFWLTVQSLCPETERAKRWLSAHGHRLLFDLERLSLD